METPPSYQHLAPAYDQLFPVDLDAVGLIESTLGSLSGKQIVDAGCGTGLLARALGDRGARVHGFDLDPDLLEVARGRSGRGVTFEGGDLRTFRLPTGFGPADAVVCFGNTLPHLTVKEDVERFFSLAAQALVPAGVLLLQILDYDFLESTNALSLPVKTVGGWTFSRTNLVRPDGLWDFRTTLEGPGFRREGVFPLRPWRRAEMEALLQNMGFVVRGVWGGFDRSRAGFSLPLVLEARLA